VTLALQIVATVLAMLMAIGSFGLGQWMDFMITNESYDRKDIGPWPIFAVCFCALIVVSCAIWIPR
jgi:hypothetical protein